MNKLLILFLLSLMLPITAWGAFFDWGDNFSWSIDVTCGDKTYYNVTGLGINGMIFRPDEDWRYQPDEFDKDAYIELFEDGTFNVSKFNKIYKGKYKIVKYKYDVYDESVLLDFDDKSIASIRFKILKDDSFCNRSTCKGDLSNYSFSDNFKLVGDWIKEK